MKTGKFVTRLLSERATFFTQFTIIRTFSKNHYNVLNVHSKASKEEIRIAYLELTKKLHPDKNLTDKDAHSRFLEIQEAYNILSNEHTRKNYDDSYKSGGARFKQNQVDKKTSFMYEEQQRMYSEWRGTKRSRSRIKKHFRVEVESSSPHQFALQFIALMAFIIASMSFINTVLDYRRDNTMAEILRDGFKK